MNVNGIGSSSPIQKLTNNPIYREVSTDGTSSSTPTDKLDLSGVSHLSALLKKNDIRADKVAQIKSQIEAGTYETDDKLSIASDKLLGDLDL